MEGYQLMEKSACSTVTVKAFNPRYFTDMGIKETERGADRLNFGLRRRAIAI